MLFAFGEMVAYKSWVLLTHAKVDAGTKAKHEASDPPRISGLQATQWNSCLLHTFRIVTLPK